MDAEEIHIMHYNIPQDSSLSLFMIRSSISRHIFMRWPFFELYKHFHFADNLNWFFFLLLNVHYATVARSLLSFSGCRWPSLRTNIWNTFLWLFFMVIIANWCTIATATIAPHNEWEAFLSYSRRPTCEQYDGWTEEHPDPDTIL